MLTEDAAWSLVHDALTECAGHEPRGHAQERELTVGASPPGSRRPSPILQIGRATGRPARFVIVAGYAASAVACFGAAAITLVVAVPDLVAGAPTNAPVLLAVHLLGLGFLPFGVAGGVLHILPVLMRNGAPGRRALIALPLLWGGPLLAVGIAIHQPILAYPAASVAGVGVLLLLVEVGTLVRRAPKGRVVMASRVGVSLSALHAAMAFTAGVIVFGSGGLFGLSEGESVTTHLNLAVLGWLTMLILTVGRTLGPMLSLAPAAGPRRYPADEILVGAGLWLIIAGIAASRALAVVGAAVVIVALVRFGLLMNRVRRGHRLHGLEAPLLHFTVGMAFLVQAGAAGLWLLGRKTPSPHIEEIYVLFLLGGFATGVTLGHLGKLLSLSAWVSWPPGPRPEQVALYPRRRWVGEASCFAVGVELVAVGVVENVQAAAYAGSGLLVASAALAAVAIQATWRAGAPAR
ncbi:MAG: hypothetical protein WCH31_09690 [Actinomycetes bacterium]